MNSFSRKGLTLFTVLLILAVLALAFAGCGVIKTKTSLQTDSTVVSKLDSGHVTKTESSSKERLDWWNELIQFAEPLPGRNDTLTYNNTEKTTQLQPLYIYREGGSKQLETYHYNYDSAFTAMYDSLSNKIKSSEKKVERNGFTLLHLIGAAVLGGIVIGLLAWLKSNFTIKKIVKTVI